MNLYVLNSKLERIGVIDDFETVIWERSFYERGTFQLETVAGARTSELLLKGNYLLKSTDTTDLRYIDSLFRSTDEEGTEKVVVQGYSVSEWFSRRITQCQEKYSGSVETVMKSYVNNNCITPKDSNRIIPNLFLAEDKQIGPSIDRSSHYKTLSSELQDISKAYNIGHLIRFNLDNKDFEFDVYCGTDRTSNQTTNPRAIFSSDFENVINESYSSIDRDFKNVAIVAGAGEEFNRKTITINSSQSGLNRYELFVDARDIQDKNMDENGNELIVPEEEYKNLLTTRGLEALEEYKTVDSFTCSLLNTGSLQYLIDYDLGDQITIVNRKWGLIMHQTIIKVIETYNSEGMDIQVDIGDSVPTIIDKIKRKIK